MDILYCFKFDDITGEITSIAITEYKLKFNQYTGRKTYSWDTPRINKADTHFTVHEEKLDRFVNNKVFTFDANFEHACRIIENTLKADIDRFEKQARRKQALLNIYIKGQKKRNRID